MRFGDITQITNAIPSWTQWTRENLDPSEDIPDIDWTGHRIKWDPNTSTIINTDVEIPWQGSAWALFNEAELQNPIRDREELLTCFADELNHNLRDAAARFTALHFYYAVATCASLTKEEEIAHVRNAFMDDLKTLVALTPVEKCQNDWRTIKWEILNSYVIRDWERARQLYDHAELVGALDELDLQLLRGHFNFLLVYDKENKDVLNSLYWEPGILHPNYKEGTFAIYNIAVLNGQTKRATLTGRE